MLAIRKLNFNLSVKPRSELFTFNPLLQIPRNRFMTIGVQRFVLVGIVATSFMLIQNIQRRALIQHFYIRRKFLYQSPAFEFPIPVMHRQQESLHLIDFLKSNPGRPLVILGTDGSGKSWTLKNLLHHRRMTVLLDLRSQPVTSANEFIYHFISATAYLMPASGYFIRWLLKEKDLEKRPRIQRDTIDKGFEAIRTCLERFKREGWKRGVPVFVISEFEASGLKASDSELSKLLNFCMSLSESGLAHFIFTSTRQFSNGVLDTYPGWKSRREVYYFPRAKTEEVSTYLTDVITPYLAAKQSTLTPDEVKYISMSLGEALDDIFTVITGLSANQKLGDAIDRLINESVQLIKSTLELYAKDSDTYKQYLNIWELMEAFKQSKMNPIPRSALINEIFKDEWEELDYLENIGLVQFHQKESVNLNYQTIQKLVESPDSELESSGLSDVVEVFPSRQRTKIAFLIVLADPQVIEQTERIQRKYKKKKLQKELDEHLVIYDRLQARKSFGLNEHETFLKFFEPLKNVVGDASIHKFLEQHDHLLIRLKDNEERLQLIDKEINEINHDLALLDK